MEIQQERDSVPQEGFCPISSEVPVLYAFGNFAANDFLHLAILYIGEFWTSADEEPIVRFTESCREDYERMNERNTLAVFSDSACLVTFIHNRSTGMVI
jgi:hypothetical protein